MDDIDAIRRAHAEFESGPVEKLLKKSPERRAQFETTSGIPIKRIYTPADRAE